MHSEITAPGWLTALVEAADVTPVDELWQLMTPPADGSGRRAAVLIAFCDTADGPALLLTERASDMRAHAGQAAFPGGAVDEADADAAATAIREAAEEVGLDPSSVRVLASLPDRYLQPSNFVVTPVIAWWAEPHPVSAVSIGEVAQAVVIPIAALADPANRFSVLSPRLQRFGPGFDIEGLFIWGFTAALLDHLLRLGGWARPWDVTITRQLP